MRLCDPFREAGLWFVVHEHDFVLTCACGVRQRLHELTRAERPRFTAYTCTHCGEVIVGLAQDQPDPRAPAQRPLVRPDDSQGHRMCGYVFASTVDMQLWPAHADDEVMAIPARPAFFTARA